MTSLLSNGLRRFCLLATVAVATGFLIAPVASASGPPTPPQQCYQYTPNPGEPFQPLEVCGSLDKASYKSSETITATVTITNVGSATATGVSLSAFTNDFDITTQFTGAGDGLNSLFTGIDIPAGATVTASANGFSSDAASGVVDFFGGTLQIVDGQEQSVFPEFQVTAAVQPVFGNYVGKIVTSQTDVNGNPLPATGLAGVAVTFNSEVTGGSSFQTTTDADGVFTFKDLPGGPYFADLAAPGGWIIAPPPVIGIATPGVKNHGRFVATRPESEILQATIGFDEPSYAVGDTAHLTITFDNLKNVPLTGILALCNLSGGGDALTGRGPGWAPFNASAGATVPAGVSTFHVSEVVPLVQPLPRQPATIGVQCAFGPTNNEEGDPAPHASAPVTGVTN
jgi:hypothetical protein